MQCPHCRFRIDLQTAPDSELKSELARRNAKKRATYTGGIYWKKHNPDTSRCRCKHCMALRERAAR